MLKVLIVDDEHLARRNIEVLLAREQDVNLVASCGRVDEALTEIAQHRPDILFLDVSMPELSGIDLLAMLRGIMQPVPEVIFVTAHDSFAVEAFGLQATDYLLKPYSAKRLKQALNLARVRVGMRKHLEEGDDAFGSSPTILIKEAGQICQVKLNEILWIDAADHYLVLNCQNGRYVWRKTMREAFDKLKQWGFVKLHRSVLANRRFIKHFFRDANKETWLELDNGKQLKVSRRRYHDLLQELNQINS